MSRWQWFQLISFQVIWFAAVLGGNQWLLIPILIMLVHFKLSPRRNADLKILSLALLGMAVDGSLVLLGIFEFKQPPFWLAILWLAFVLNFGHSLIYLRRIQACWLMVLGACAGSYAYLVSWKVGAVELPMGAILSGIVIASVWSVLLPIMVKSDRWIREG